MSTIDTYGELDLPEETATIEVVENPVQVVLASYDLFKRTNSQFFKINWYRSEKRDLVYNEALKVYEGKQELKVDEKQLEQIIEELRKRAKNFDGTGLFLSAMLNTTKINTLFVDEFPELDLIGYKIDKNKAVILGPKNNSFDIGDFAKEGSVTINQGTTDFQGCETEGGNHINQGRVNYNEGWYAIGGNHINKGSIYLQAGYAKGGNHINQKKTSSLSNNATGGNHINLKTIEEWIGMLVIGLSQKENELKKELEKKLAELDFLKEKEPRKLIQLVTAYDWHKWEKELNQICIRIQKAYGEK